MTKEVYNMEELKQKILDFFKDLTFSEEGHKYYVNVDIPLKTSVSGLIKQYKYPTNWKEVLEKTALRHGKTEEEVSREWNAEAEKGCARGNKAHLFGEVYAIDRSIEAETGLDKAIENFWNDLPEYIVPFLLEIRMYHKEYMFAGTADILLYDTRNGKLYIADYKTNKDLFKNFNGQRMVGPFSHLLCNPFNHYQLQLSYYQVLIEQIPGIKISGRKLIWLKTDGTYLLYNLDDYTDVLKNELKNI